MVAQQKPENESTSMKITKKTRDKIRTFAITRNETMEDIIIRIIEQVKA